jgi:hypothetical protein
MQQYRQGDLLFIKQEALPADLKPRATRVILEGETTGHAHRLTAGTVVDAPYGGIWLDVPVSADVVHEEHQAVSFDAGPWLVIRQRECVAPDISRGVID